MTKPPKIAGEDAFTLYATYGFPIDLTQLMARERGFEVDLAGFEREMARHREISGAGDAFKAQAVAGLPATDDSAKYEGKPIEATVRGWVIDGVFQSAGALVAGVEAAVVLDKTNFYAETGGQVGDSGRLEAPSGVFLVRDTQYAGQCVLHVGAAEKGELRVGDKVKAAFDATRGDTMRNHTATHMLNWALRIVLGEHVNQAGSVVAPDRLHFDFSHHQAVTAEQLATVEDMVNQLALADQKVSSNVMPLAQAKKIPGVRAVFGEKYPDPVRVISIGAEDPLKEHAAAAAIEFCGGTHLSHTSQVGLFKIIAEESVAKGVRRITAVTGRGAIEHVSQLDQVVRQVSAALKVPPASLPERIAAMQKEIKDLRKKGASASAAQGGQSREVARSEHGPVLVIQAEGLDGGTMRTMCDKERQKGAAAVFVGCASADKVTLVAMVDEKLAAGGKLTAGDWVKAVAPVVGGSGGGKPTLAQAGGKDPSKLADALAAAADYAAKALT